MASSIVFASVVVANEQITVNVTSNTNVGVAFGELLPVPQDLQLTFQAGTNGEHITSSRVVDAAGSALWNPLANNDPGFSHTYVATGISANDSHWPEFYGTLGNIVPGWGDVGGPVTTPEEFRVQVGDIDVDVASVPDNDPQNPVYTDPHKMPFPHGSDLSELEDTLENVSPQHRSISRDTITVYATLEAIVNQVAKNPNAAGFYLTSPGQRSDDRIRIVAIGKDAKAQAYLPTEENIWNEKYPLVEQICLWVHPDAPQAVHDFGRFAVTSSEAAAIIRKHKYFAEFDRQQYLGKQRELMVKRGEGTPVRLYGALATARLAMSRQWLWTRTGSGLWTSPRCRPSWARSRSWESCRRENCFPRK